MPNNKNETKEITTTLEESYVQINGHLSDDDQNQDFFIVEDSKAELDPYQPNYNKQLTDASMMPLLSALYLTCRDEKNNLNRTQNPQVKKNNLKESGPSYYRVDNLIMTMFMLQNSNLQEQYAFNPTIAGLLEQVIDDVECIKNSNGSQEAIRFIIGPMITQTFFYSFSHIHHLVAAMIDMRLKKIYVFDPKIYYSWLNTPQASINPPQLPPDYKLEMLASSELQNTTDSTICGHKTLQILDVLQNHLSSLIEINAEINVDRLQNEIKEFSNQQANANLYCENLATFSHLSFAPAKNSQEPWANEAVKKRILFSCQRALEFFVSLNNSYYKLLSVSKNLQVYHNAFLRLKEILNDQSATEEDEKAKAILENKPNSIACEIYCRNIIIAALNALGKIVAQTKELTLLLTQKMDEKGNLIVPDHNNLSAIIEKIETFVYRDDFFSLRGTLLKVLNRVNSTIAQQSIQTGPYVDFLFLISLSCKKIDGFSDIFSSLKLQEDKKIHCAAVGNINIANVQREASMVIQDVFGDLLRLSGKFVLCFDASAAELELAKAEFKSFNREEERLALLITKMRNCEARGKAFAKALNLLQLAPTENQQTEMLKTLLLISKQYGGDSKLLLQDNEDHSQENFQREHLDSKHESQLNGGKLNQQIPPAAFAPIPSINKLHKTLAPKTKGTLIKVGAAGGAMVTVGAVGVILIKIGAGSSLLGPWVWPVSLALIAVGGFMVVASLAYGAYKSGFFSCCTKNKDKNINRPATPQLA